MRPWKLEELSDYLAIRTDPEIGTHIPGHPLTLEAATEMHSKALSRTAIETSGDGLSLALERADDSVLVGTVGLYWRSEEHRQAEIGYILLPAYFGHGYATEAAARLVELAFLELGAHRVFAELDACNAPSERVCRRLGMRLEGVHREKVLDGESWTDLMIYALLEREWRSCSPAGGPAPG